MTPFIIVGTGHRPQDIALFAGDRFAYANYAALVACASRALSHTLSAYKLAPQDVLVVAGGALGWDTALADAAIQLGLRVRLCLPYPTEAQCVARWSHLPGHVRRWRWVLSRADSVHFGDGQLQGRNLFMLDHLSGARGCVLAFWSGKPRGGTFNCLAAARQRGLVCHNAWRFF